MNAESLMHEHGTVAVIVHKDQLGREEKEAVRAAVSDPSSGILQVGSHFVLFIQEEPDDEVDALALAAYEEFQADGGEQQEPVMPPNMPTIPDELEGLTVAQLKEIAETEEIDISDVKLKADIVGRIWGAREMRAETEKENG